MTNHKKPGVAFWATVVVVGVALYVASFGPACWLATWMGRGSRILTTVYRPVIWVWDTWPRPLSPRLHWYTRLAASGDYWWAGTGADSIFRDSSQPAP